MYLARCPCKVKSNMPACRVKQCEYVVPRAMHVNFLPVWHRGRNAPSAEQPKASNLCVTVGHQITVVNDKRCK